MSISLSNITGGAQTGFTTPGYTVSVDSTSSNGKQWAITAITGTQTGVTAHSTSSPFTVGFWRPVGLKVLGFVSQIVGVKRIPRNVFTILVRKGVTPNVGLPADVMVIRMFFDVPAGSDTYDAANVRAAISAAVGTLNQVSSGWGDTVVNAVL